MESLFDLVFYKPIFFLLVFIYKNLVFKDFGLAVIVLTLILRIVLFPLFQKSLKNQVLSEKIQPEIKKIQEQYKNDKEKQVKELLNLYQKYKFNPLSSIFLVLVQLPFLFALFKIFTKGLDNNFFESFYFLNLIDLKKPDIFLVFLTAGFQYLQNQISLRKVEKITQQAKIMMFFAPFLTLIILANLPSALALYWLVSTIFSIFQQLFIEKKEKIC